MKTEGTIKSANLGFQLGAAGQFLFFVVFQQQAVAYMALGCLLVAEMYPKRPGCTPSLRRMHQEWVEVVGGPGCMSGCSSSSCLVGTSPSLGAESMSVLSCVCLTAKARGGNGVRGGFAGCVHKFRSCLSCLSDAHGYRGSLHTAALKLFLHTAAQGCCVLPHSARWLFSEKL